MAPRDETRLWRAAALLCVAALGSWRSGAAAHGAPPEPFIFKELCALKSESGPCKAIKERFFFNVDTGRCELFEYGGCGGNANNFESMAECEETCVVSDDKDPCHLAEAAGPCRGLVTRYFFDSESRECKHFFYGGCFGNANNFKTLADCQAKCQNPAKPSRASEVYTQSSRKLDVQPTIVTGGLTVVEPQVQPSSGNQETGELKADELCFSPVDKGLCHGNEMRFAYNPKIKRCQTFYYSGCGGNANNFTTRKLCFRKCIRRRKAHGTEMIRIRRKNVHIIAH